MQIRLDPQNVRGRVPSLRGVYLGDSAERLVEEDFIRFRQEVGITGVRLGMEPRTLADEKQRGWKEDGFRYIQDQLDWSAKLGIRCVLDLHNALGRLYGGDSRLWKERYFQDRFVEMWQEVVRRFRGHPAVAAYEFINEPEPPDRDFAVWNQLYKRTLAAVRELDPDQAVIIDSIGYANPTTFAGLEPSGDPHTVYSFHNYAPGPYHAQKRREREDQSTYYYPGFIPEVTPEKPLDFDQAHVGTEKGMFWNRKELLEHWREVFVFQARHDVPLYCGEFGCVSDVPEMTDMVYLADEISIFQEQGIDWAMYNGMWRTKDEYWNTHFDCCVYTVYSPDESVRRFGRKAALLEFFCRTEGDVLRFPEPSDEWVGAYAVRTPDHGVRALLSNKDRHESKTVTLHVDGLPAQWKADLKTMARGDEGFVRQNPRELKQGAVELTLPPLSLALVTVPPPYLRSWT